jgi:dihydropyrimidine dehydrogenase (NAD+) subunit PreA
MANLKCNFAGVESPNPFWLASAPPTDKQYNVERAFEAGWGGVVWKTLGESGPPIVNVCSRYGSIDYNGQRMIGLNNIELITDRPLEVNLKEITAVKKAWPDRAIVVSLMVPCNEQAWRDIVRQVEQTGCDGIELNFGCPHGMSERGMGSAVGQVPEYIRDVTAWCKASTGMPVLVKLTPNITDIRYPARAAREGGADAVSLINTINSIVSINLDNFSPEPSVGGQGAHGGYCGPAVKPIALSMVSEIARDPETRGLPISGIGGIGTWRDAAEYIALGCGNVQVCTAAMRFGFRIIDDMVDGLNNWMDEKDYQELDDFRGKAIDRVTSWNQLDLNYKTLAVIDQNKCIECGLCHIVCEDASHQAIAQSKDENGQRRYSVIEDECVGCNLCYLVCPIPDCITMEPQDTGLPYLNWDNHPNNPMKTP